jgi:hypothetical protein
MNNRSKNKNPLLTIFDDPNQFEDIMDKLVEEEDLIQRLIL